MDEKKRRRAELRSDLVKALVKMGHPAEFGAAIADQLGTEKTINRMIRISENSW